MRGSGRALPLELVPTMATRPETEARLCARPYLFCDEQVALRSSQLCPCIGVVGSESCAIVTCGIMCYRHMRAVLRRELVGTPAKQARGTFCR
jgi:hypothetical protein